MQNTDLGTNYPIIQAPMNWVTNAALVAAVSNAGGLGVLGTNAGQTTVATDPEVVEKRMRQEIEKTKRLTDKPFGINILTPGPEQSLSESPYTMALLNAAFEAEIYHFIVVGVAHPETFALIKQHHGFIIFRPLTPTIEAVQQAERLGADIIVATGRNEGGVLPDTDLDTLMILPEIIDAVTIPIFAAGGINDRWTAKTVLKLGAAGIYVGTRFLVASEAPVAMATKKLIVQSKSHDTVLVSGNQRAVATPRAREFADNYLEQQDTVTSNRQISQDGGLRTAMLLGQLDHGIVTVNTEIGLIEKVEPAADIVDELIK